MVMMVIMLIVTMLMMMMVMVIMMMMTAGIVTLSYGSVSDGRCAWKTRRKSRSGDFGLFATWPQSLSTTKSILLAESQNLPSMFKILQIEGLDSKVPMTPQMQVNSPATCCSF